MNRKKIFIANTFLLTAITLCLRAVGVSFNVYLANKIGAKGMGLFSLIMSVYNFGITFACSGINLASTKIVSEEMAWGNENGIKRTVIRSCVYALIFGGLAFLLIFFGASFAGNVFLGDKRTVIPLKILSISLPCVSVSSAISGYFNAVGRVYKNGLVQIAEQLVRILGCIILLQNAAQENAEAACKAVVLSGAFAEIFSFALIVVICIHDIRRYHSKKSGDKITKRILGVALPVAVSSYARSGLNTVEHSMIPKGLKKYGGDSDLALSAYGIVHGMVMPIIFFPSSVLHAFATLLVPEVTICAETGRTEKITALIEKTLYLTLVFSIGCSGIMFFFAEEIGLMVYKSYDAAYFLKLISPLAVLMYADGVVDAVLKGLNQQVYSMGYNIIDSALSIVLMIFLLPTKGIHGYLIIIYVTEMVNAFLSINRLIYVADFKIKPVKWAILPITAITVSSFFARSIGCDKNSSAIGIIVLSAVVYTFIMLIFFKGDKAKSAIAKHCPL